ncbi:Tm-1-like ATP-binding domain-containing protein [Paenibacillus pasadenensis]|uniref:Tm-1-like ATP-binding domain-containing protein n=1 Tax=Paenibacillus pasadenensis TaxID=217090 RepID=UPI00203C2D82|nr:Tm-1-like ATP-binding domain-containing protein [Paenibacillus pasadenensis]MCM3747048.1 Tm-1-like ATP-binding domain-containing protein [Paenibacillus pasadenensis]
MSKHIVVIGTLDTKGPEVEYICRLIRDRGHIPLIVDSGIKGVPTVTPDLSRHEVAAASGTTIGDLLAAGDKNAAIEAMTRGLERLALRLYGEGRLDGLLSIGGVQGTMMATAAMRTLPVGVPKLMVSAVANGQTAFGPFVGTKDVTIMHSVADITGLNAITRAVFRQAVGAITGMAEMGPDPGQDDRPLIGITMAGVTTACVMRAVPLLEALGYDTVVFHCNGIGAKAMEELAADGRLAGILDLSPHDVSDLLHGGIMPAHAGRFEASGRRGIPQVVAPGCADIVLYGPMSSVPEKARESKLVRHNPIHTHVKADRAQMRETGAFIGQRLAASSGPAAVLIPLRGFSELNAPGGPLYEPESDAAFAEGAEGALTAAGGGARTSLLRIDAHINDPEFAAAAVRELDRMIREQRKA